MRVVFDHVFIQFKFLTGQITQIPSAFILQNHFVLLFIQLNFILVIFVADEIPFIDLILDTVQILFRVINELPETILINSLLLFEVLFVFFKKQSLSGKEMVLELNVKSVIGFLRVEFQTVDVQLVKN